MSHKLTPNLSWLNSNDLDRALEFVAVAAIEAREKRASMQKQATPPPREWYDVGGHIGDLLGKTHQWFNDNPEATKHIGWGLGGAGAGAALGLGSSMLASPKRRRSLSAMLQGGVLGGALGAGGSALHSNWNTLFGSGAGGNGTGGNGTTQPPPGSQDIRIQNPTPIGPENVNVSAIGRFLTPEGHPNYSTANRIGMTGLAIADAAGSNARSMLPARFADRQGTDALGRLVTRFPTEPTIAGRTPAMLDRVVASDALLHQHVPGVQNDAFRTYLSRARLADPNAMRTIALALTRGDPLPTIRGVPPPMIGANASGAGGVPMDSTVARNMLARFPTSTALGGQGVPTLTPATTLGGQPTVSPPSRWAAPFRFMARPVGGGVVPGTNVAVPRIAAYGVPILTEMLLRGLGDRNQSTNDLIQRGLQNRPR